MRGSAPVLMACSWKGRRGPALVGPAVARRAHRPSCQVPDARNGGAVRRTAMMCETPPSDQESPHALVRLPPADKLCPGAFRVERGVNAATWWQSALSASQGACARLGCLPWVKAPAPISCAELVWGKSVPRPVMHWVPLGGQRGPQEEVGGAATRGSAERVGKGVRPRGRRAGGHNRSGAAPASRRSAARPSGPGPHPRFARRRGRRSGSEKSLGETQKALAPVAVGGAAHGVSSAAHGVCEAAPERSCP